MPSATQHHTTESPDRRSAADFLPSSITYPALCKAAAGCRGCDLYKHATQTVFGEGAIKARLMLIGEQPGNEEDLAGHPFIGPAGKLLARSMEEAGLKRDQVYITNAVKHFKFAPSGKRRIHKKPSPREVKACKPWLEAEITLIKPKAIVCLGATAAQSLLGNGFSLMKNLGRWEPRPDGSKVAATYHPSAALRAPDPEIREKIYKAIVETLKSIGGNRDG